MIQTLPLFRPLNTKLLQVLRALPPADWSKQTVAGRWTIKDVAAHLLDGNLRAIALYRDQWELPPAAITDYQSLVDYLNQLNAEWVTATRRLSPAILTEWLETTHEPYIRCLEQLDPRASAVYSVAWAGESVSTNAFHIAREYTEKWHHQQQIRDALGSPEIMTKEFYRPVLDTFLMALPYAYRDTKAPTGTRIQIEIDTDAGGQWTLERSDDAWRFSDDNSLRTDASVKIPGALAWKFMTKAISPEVIRHHVHIQGSEALVLPCLRMIAVMA